MATTPRADPTWAEGFEAEPLSDEEDVAPWRLEAEPLHNIERVLSRPAKRAAAQRAPAAEGPPAGVRLRPAEREVPAASSQLVSCALASSPKGWPLLPNLAVSGAATA